MFIIDDDKTIHINRGDIGVISTGATEKADDGDKAYTFAIGDIVRLNVYEPKKPESVVLQKSVDVSSVAESVDIELTRGDTKIGEYISKPKEYYYEIELNPDTAPQTIIGYDKAGPKKFILYPEGGEIEK